MAPRGGSGGQGAVPPTWQRPRRNNGRSRGCQRGLSGGCREGYSSSPQRQAGCQAPRPARSSSFGASEVPGPPFPTSFPLNTLPGFQLLGNLNQAMFWGFVCLIREIKSKTCPGAGVVLSRAVGEKSASSLGNIYIFFSQTGGRLGFSLIRILQQKEAAWETERDPQARVPGPPRRRCSPGLYFSLIFSSRQLWL